MKFTHEARTDYFKLRLLPDEQKQHNDQSGFQLYKSKYREAGTGGIYQLNDHLWVGKFSPRDAYGKRIYRNVYAKTREECEEKLAAMIEEVKKEIAAAKLTKKERHPDLANH